MDVADWLASIKPGVSDAWRKAFVQAKVTSVEQLKALEPKKLENLFYRLHLIEGATIQRERVIAAVSAIRSVPRGLAIATSRLVTGVSLFPPGWQWPEVQIENEIAKRMQDTFQT